MLYKFGRFLFWVLFKSFYGLKVYGRENIPAKGGFIVASNHISYLDPPLVGVGCARDLNFMAKEELFRNGLFGMILYAVNAFPVKRDSADLSAIKEALKRVKGGRGLMIFPEGARQKGGRLGEPEPGIGFLARKLDVPIIPAFVKGTDTALPEGAKSLRRARISISFGKQITIERRMANQEAATIIMQAIKHLSCSKSN